MVCPRPSNPDDTRVGDLDGVAPCSRFAFSASRRVGNAVKRNRAKRVLREAVRWHLGEIEPGWDCLFIARAQTPDAAFADVEAAVSQLLTRAQLLTVDVV